MDTLSILISGHSPIIFKEIKLQIDKSRLYNFQSDTAKKNKYGDCDFCEFSISDKSEVSCTKGLYFFSINNEIVHIGKVDTDITNIINNGFGKITQSNCLIKGTSTFCHINSLIASENAKVVKLFIWSSNGEEDLTLIKKAIDTILKKENPQKDIPTKALPQKDIPKPINKTPIYHIIADFFNNIIHERDIEIYNEFSLQHELGIYLRECLPKYKVQFERNVSFFTNTKGDTVKKEIDLTIFQENGEKYAIELKCPQNGQYPEQMYSFVKDIKFMEQLKEDLGFSYTYCVTLVFDKNFYTSKNKQDGIYPHFRNENNENKVYGTIFKPTGKTKGEEGIDIKKTYELSWVKFDNSDKRYYIIEI